MSEYQDPIRISPNDPICSATAMNGTIVGILFNKTGAEIKEAMGKRVKAIDAKIAECQAVVKGVNDFLVKKEKQIEEIDDLYTKRADLKKSKMRPFEREVEDIYKKMTDLSHDLNKETEKMAAEKAVGFADGIDGLEEKLEGIDNLIEDEELMDRDVRPRSMLRSKAITDSLTGIQGATGLQGPSGGSIGIGEGTPHTYLTVTQTEDEALARLETLKKHVKEYRNKIKLILGFIKGLMEEKRRLELIRKHIRDTSEFKLDLNKLSAFGFEDITVE